MPWFDKSEDYKFVQSNQVHRTGALKKFDNLLSEIRLKWSKGLSQLNVDTVKPAVMVTFVLSRSIVLYIYTSRKHSLGGI
jgi:hypothetical protein